MKSFVFKRGGTFEAAYKEMLEQIRSQEDHALALAMRAFQWVKCSGVPIQTAELLQAIAYDPDSDCMSPGETLSKDGLLKLSRNLLVRHPSIRIDGHPPKLSLTEAWTFSHLSVSEYLETYPGCSIKQAHIQVAKGYLGCLCTQGPRKIYPDLREVWNHDFWFTAGMQLPYYLQNANLGDVMLVSRLKRFFGSPTKSTPQYWAWVKCFRKIVRGRHKLTDEQIRRWINDWHLNISVVYPSDFLPSTCPMRGLCVMGIYDGFADWWHSPTFNPTCSAAGGRPLLILAIKFNHSQIWKHLLTHYPKESLQSPVQRPHQLPLVAAAERGDLPAAQALMDAGKKVGIPHDPWLLDHALNAVRHDGCNTNENDCRSVEIIRLLVGAGAHVNLVESCCRDSRLVGAVKSGCSATVKYLLECGAEPNQTSRTGSSPLILAAINGNNKIARLLLDHGADPSSALGAAAKYGKARTIRSLLEFADAYNVQLPWGGFDSMMLADVLADVLAEEVPDRTGRGEALHPEGG